MNLVKLTLASAEAYVPKVFEHTDKDEKKDGTYDVTFNVFIPEQSGNAKAKTGDKHIFKHTVNSANPKAMTLGGAQTTFSGEVTIDADSAVWKKAIPAWQYAVQSRNVTFTVPVQRQPADKVEDKDLGL
jgi:hypothetical protein